MKRRGIVRPFGLAVGLICAASISVARAGEEPKVWIFFKDKGPGCTSGRTLQKARAELSAQALWRRAKVLGPDEVVDETDVPVYSPYVDSLRALGVRVVVTSRWLNATSGFVSDSIRSVVEDLPFVLRTQAVARVVRRLPPPEETPRVGLEKPAVVQALDYGPSYTQLALMRVPALHRWGVVGSGVIVGMLDSGFNWQGHEAFQGIAVLGEHDFIWDDDITHDQEGQDFPGQHNHGTQTLSVIAGFAPGQLIGSAFGASFYLAKTERVTDVEGRDFEERVEEDYWVAGLEWLERNGVDLVSSSVGYLDWYTPEDLDGNTAAVTIAADLAAKKGVLVFNSAGNEGRSAWRKIITPADGDSVVAVGAVRSDTNIVGFSSRGPTADGRIKPDVVAMGSGVYAVDPTRFSGYMYVQGTSFACPLAAGVGALVLSAHPYLKPMELREALRQTAGKAASPDTVYGWGLVDAVKAALYYGPLFSNVPQISTVNDSVLEVSTFVVSKDGVLPGSAKLHYSLDRQVWSELGMAPTDTVYQYRASLPPLPPGTQVFLRFSVHDSALGQVEHPRFPADAYRFVVGGSAVVPPWVPETTQLHAPYPNPFRTVTRLSFELRRDARVTLQLFNPLGQLVRTFLAGRTLRAGRYGFDWRGKDDAGQPVAAGVYIIRLQVNGSASSARILYLHR